MTGLFLTLEGVEGVGKTTNINFIVDYLRRQNIEVVETREPGGTRTGERIRQVLLDTELDISSDAELLLMFASRAELVSSVIKPALSEGKWVVSDRFTDASFAYQGGGRGLGFDRVEQLEQWLLSSFKPDCTFFLDLPVEIGLERLKVRQEKDRIEKEATAFFQTVRNAYHQRINADRDRFVLVDASQSLNDVQADIQAALQKQVEAWR